MTTPATSLRAVDMQLFNVPLLMVAFFLFGYAFALKRHRDRQRRQFHVPLTFRNEMKRRGLAGYARYVNDERACGY